MNTRLSPWIYPIVSFFLMISMIGNVHARRGIEEMIDPVELFYVDSGKLSDNAASRLIEDTIKSSNRPKWVITSKGAHVYRAVASQRRLSATVDIVLAEDGIKIKYVNSERMQYRVRQNKKYVRDIYNRWASSLAKQLESYAKSTYQIALVGKKKHKLLKGKAAGKDLIVIAVRALPDVRPKRNGPVWSAQIGEAVAGALDQEYGSKHLFTVLPWNRETLNFVKGGYGKSYNKKACDANESQGVITIGVVVDSTDTDGMTGSEEMALSYYNCVTEKLIVKSVRADYKRTDKFNLQTSSIMQVKKLLESAGFKYNSGN